MAGVCGIGVGLGSGVGDCVGKDRLPIHLALDCHTPSRGREVIRGSTYARDGGVPLNEMVEVTSRKPTHRQKG